MYVNRIQIANNGPIEQLDITFPFDRDRPKPVILLGKNGSGKSIFLSHIVNGLLSAKHFAFRNAPEVEPNKVYKLRDTQYITTEKEFSFARVDFTDRLWIGELQFKRNKQEVDDPPLGVAETDAKILWDSMPDTARDYIDISSFDNSNQMKALFDNNCVLYFPPDRYEDPAWLNEKNLLSKAFHLDMSRLEGYTERKVINYSPLRMNRDWLFELVYDVCVFELQTSSIIAHVEEDSGSLLRKELSVHQGYSGVLRHYLVLALQVIQCLLGQDENLTIGIGRRHYRSLFVKSKERTIIPNIFQLSSGEISLLNLFLTILRDYDLTTSELQQAEDVRGIVVVDEIDLHLHSHHQYEILPRLLSMFPNVQFVLTTHSPLFILGLHQILGQGGFELYNLPEGQRISAEEFSEFETAYSAFTSTMRHDEEIRTAIRMPKNHWCLLKALLIEIT